MIRIFDKITDLPAIIVILILAALFAIYVFLIIIEEKWS